MTSLVRSTSGGQAASESGDGRHSASDESTEIAQVIDTQPGNTIPFPTSRVAAAPPTVIETNIVQPPITDQDNENQTWKENGAESRRHSTAVTEPGNTIPIPTSGVAAAPPTTIEINVVRPPITGDITASRTDRQSMYKAAFEGDWRAAKMLLDRDPTLACDEITERGDRALHVAVAFKHTKFVQKLIEQMSPSDLALQDGQGQTPCCYAAISGNVQIADVMLKKNPNLVTESDIIDVALEILENDRSLATMKDDDDRTALHILALQDMSDDNTTKKSILFKSLFGMDVTLNPFFTRRKMRSDLRSLAKKLWDEIQSSSEKASVFELIKKPSILHDAAKVGNVELITMLTHTYPDLIWDTDSNRHTMFHIAAIHRQENVFGLIHQKGAMKDLIAKSQDENGNNILHLAAKLGPLNGRKIVSQSARQMHKELAWFKKVEAIVPPSCLETRNKDDRTPREMFSEEHKDLFEKSEAWMRSTANSCMLIATIIFTVVFAAAFTPPGGNNSETGIPILLKKSPTPFAFFIIFEGIALFGSIFSIIMFWSIMTSSFEDDLFLEILPFQLKLGLSGLLVSLIGAISAFMSAYFLFFVDKSVRLVDSFIALAYFSLVIVICCKISGMWSGIRERFF